MPEPIYHTIPIRSHLCDEAPVQFTLFASRHYLPSDFLETTFVFRVDAEPAGKDKAVASVLESPFFFKLTCNYAFSGAASATSCANSDTMSTLLEGHSGRVSGIPLPS